MSKLTLIIVLVVAFGASNIHCQLMDHGDKELNQLLLFNKYLNESRNVQHLLKSEIKYKSTLLKDNIESSIYNIPSLTLLDRQTCLFMGAVINSNSKHFKKEPFITLMNQLMELQSKEKYLDEYVVNQSENLKDVSKLSLDSISSMFIQINISQKNLISTLEKIHFENECDACKEPIRLYQEVTKKVNSSHMDKDQNLGEITENINIEKWNEFPYPKELITNALTKMTELKNELNHNKTDEDLNNLLNEFYFKPDGVTQLLNEALLKFKNQNKNVKYLGQLVPEVGMKSNSR